MKRLLPFIPVLLLLLVNSCVQADPLDSTGTATAIANTIYAAIWTATPTPTFNPAISAMVSWLNMDLVTTNALGATIDADYHVNKISFQNIPNSSALIFRVNVGCTCMNTDNCCIPERTFVVIVESMKKNRDTNLVQVPSEVSRMLVVCSDQKTKSQIGAISASWQDVQSYIWGTLDGHQLGVQVTRIAAP